MRERLERRRREGVLRVGRDAMKPSSPLRLDAGRVLMLSQIGLGAEG